MSRRILWRGIQFGATMLIGIIANGWNCADYALAQSDPNASVYKLGQAVGSIERLDPALDSIVSGDAKPEVIGTGYGWSEGPVWVRQGKFLLFSDVLGNTVHRWDKAEGARPFVKPSGYTSKVSRGGETGSNGLVLDNEGRLVLCQHGDRRVARLDLPLESAQPNYITLADKFDGKRFNSPNDTVVDARGNIYFTDPPYGLEKNMDDPAKEIDFQGVYRIAPDGTVSLLTKEMERPNGIALSPDQKTLYVANSHNPRPVVVAFELRADGTVGPGRELFSGRRLANNRSGGFDGMTLDARGNLFVTGPGGVLIVSPDGKHLGTIVTGQRTANCEFGEDGSTLFITADDYLMKIPTKTKGVGF